MGRNKLYTAWFLLAGVILAVVVPGNALKGTTLVINKLKGKQADGSPLPTASPAPIAESRSDIDVAPPSGGGESIGVVDAAGANATTKSPLTGIPQIDYVHDPNLPRELNGYNLTDYPFYDRVPDDIDFKCDGLHDGFYASIPHKCQICSNYGNTNLSKQIYAEQHPQRHIPCHTIFSRLDQRLRDKVYHHCLFGTRYDFLCANYTAFDQKTFICHFVSEVDCENSAKYFKRNEALYKAATTAAPSTTHAPPPPPQAPAMPRRPLATSAVGTGPAGRRRRPYRRRRPVYDYYYDEDYEEDPDYYEDELPVQQGGSTTAPPPPPPPRRRRKRPRPQQRPLPADEQPEVISELIVPPADSKSRPTSSVYDRPRVPPKIRRPVPLNEREKYDYKNGPMPLPASAADSRPVKSQTRTPPPPADDYYDDEEDYAPPVRTTQVSKPRNPDYYPPSASSDRDIVRRPSMTGAGRPLRRNRPSGPGSARRRPADSTAYSALPLEDDPDDYDASYEQEPPLSPPPRRRPGTGRKRVPATSQRQEPETYYRQPARPQVEEDYSPPRKPAPTYSQRGGSRYEEEEEDVEDLPVPAPRPAYISTAPGVTANAGAVRQVYRKRLPPPEDEYVPAPRAEAPSYNRRPISQVGRKQTAQRQPPPPTASYEDSAEYYDDEEEEPAQPPSNLKARPKQQSQPRTAYRSSAPSKAPPAQYPKPSPSPPVSKELEDEEDTIVPPSRAARPFLPSRGGNPTLPRGLQPLGTKAESSSPKSLPVAPASSSFRPRSDDPYPSPAPVKTGALLPEPLTSKPLVPQPPKISAPLLEDAFPKSQTEFRSGGGKSAPAEDGASARSRTQSGGDDPGYRTSGKYRPSSAQKPTTYHNKNDDVTNAKTSPLLPQKPDSKSALPPPPPARINLADIDDYDVSLNDALHPTLHPTRSIATDIVSFPQQQARPQSFRSPGRSSPLTAAASQRQYTRTPYESEVGQTYQQPSRKRQRYTEANLSPPPVQHQQYHADGQSLSLSTHEQEDDTVYISERNRPSPGYSMGY